MNSALIKPGELGSIEIKGNDGDFEIAVNDRRVFLRLADGFWSIESEGKMIHWIRAYSRWAAVRRTVEWMLENDRQEGKP